MLFIIHSWEDTTLHKICAYSISIYYVLNHNLYSFLWYVYGNMDASTQIRSHLVLMLPLQSPRFHASNGSTKTDSNTQYNFILTSLSTLFCKFALSQTFMMLMHFLLLCTSSSCWILNWIWNYISYVFAQKQKKVWFNDKFHYLSKSSENYSKIVHSHSLSLLWLQDSKIY